MPVNVAPVRPGRGGRQHSANAVADDSAREMAALAATPENEAAVKIQAAYRGRVARRKAAVMREFDRLEGIERGRDKASKLPAASALGQRFPPIDTVKLRRRLKANIQAVAEYRRLVVFLLTLLMFSLLVTFQLRIGDAFVFRVGVREAIETPSDLDDSSVYDIRTVADTFGHLQAIVSSYWPDEPGFDPASNLLNLASIGPTYIAGGITLRSARSRLQSCGETFEDIIACPTNRRDNAPVVYEYEHTDDLVALIEILGCLEPNPAFNASTSDPALVYECLLACDVVSGCDGLSVACNGSTAEPCTLTVGGTGFEILILGSLPKATVLALLRGIQPALSSADMLSTTFEVLTINPSVDMMGFLEISIRFQPEGKTKVSLELESAVSIAPLHEGVLVVAILLLLFVFVDLVVLVMTVRSSVRTVREELLSFWGYVDFFYFCVAATVISMAFVVERWRTNLDLLSPTEISVSSSDDLVVLQDKTDRILSFGDVARVHTLNAGIFLLISIVRVFRYFRVQGRLARLTGTIEAAATDVGHFLLLATALFFGFAAAAMVMFGAFAPDFMTIEGGMYVLLLFALGLDSPDLELLQRVEPVGTIVFVVFFVVSMLVVVNMLLSIVIEAYDEVRTRELFSKTLFRELRHLNQKSAYKVATRLGRVPPRPSDRELLAWLEHQRRRFLGVQSFRDRFVHGLMEDQLEMLAHSAVDLSRNPNMLDNMVDEDEKGETDAQRQGLRKDLEGLFRRA